MNDFVVACETSVPVVSGNCLATSYGGGVEDSMTRPFWVTTEGVSPTKVTTGVLKVTRGVNGCRPGVTVVPFLRTPGRESVRSKIFYSSVAQGKVCGHSLCVLLKLHFFSNTWVS